jgi:hypothetical protein
MDALPDGIEQPQVEVDSPRFETSKRTKHHAQNIDDDC